MDTCQVQAREVNYCDFLIQYFSSPQAVEDKKTEAISLLRDRQIKGFRKGKAPDHVIKTMFKKEIDDYVTVKLSAEAYKDVLFETKLNPLGAPQFTKAQVEGDKFFCEFRQLTKPVIELKQYKEFEIPKPAPAFKVSEKIEEALQELRIKHAELMPFSDCDTVDVAELNDRVTLDIEAKDAFDPTESKIEKMCHEGLLYTIGQNLYPGFDDEILGMKIGETRKFNLKLPKEQVSDLKGDTATVVINFKVTLQMGLKTLPHPLDDELAQNEGLSTFAELESALLARANQLSEQAEKVAIQQQVVQRLLANHAFKIPEWLIEEEAKQLKDQNLTQAENNLRLTFLLEEIRKAEPESGLSDMELIGSLKRQVQDNPQLAEWLTAAEQNGQLKNWLSNARVEYVLQWIINTCKITE